MAIKNLAGYSCRKYLVYKTGLLHIEIFYTSYHDEIFQPCGRLNICLLETLPFCTRPDSSYCTDSSWGTYPCFIYQNFKDNIIFNFITVCKFARFFHCEILTQLPVNKALINLSNINCMNSQQLVASNWISPFPEQTETLRLLDKLRRLKLTTARSQTMGPCFLGKFLKHRTMVSLQFIQ